MDEPNIQSLERGEIKRYLQASGSQVWKDFCKRRTALERRSGLTQFDANTAAVEEFRIHIETGSQLEEKRLSVPRGTPLDRAASFGVEMFQCSKDSFEDESSCSSGQAVDWVFDNLALRDLVSTDAPSPGAWGLLCWVRMSPGNLTEFYRVIWAKRLPSRSQIDDGKDYRDDGRQELAEMDRILRIAEEERRATADNEVAQTVEETPALAEIGAPGDTGNESDDGWDA